MPFGESPSTIEAEPSVEDKKEKTGIGTPEELQQYLQSFERFRDFELKQGIEEDLVEDLDDNPDRLIYRGIPPKQVLRLASGKSLRVLPYKYDKTEDTGEELQNASYLYSNAISHGYDKKQEFLFLSAVGFSPDGLEVKNTGAGMADRFASTGESNFLPQGREYDVSITGTLKPKNISVFCFRFKDGDKFRTLVYQRKKK